jgi:phage baseplate assembly protein W
MWKDIDIFLTKQQDGDIKAMTDLEAIKNSLINIFSTIKGSRRMLPDAFIFINGILFEPMDEETSRRLGEGLVSAIRKWDDRIYIESFNVEMDEDNNQYKTTLYYSLINSDNVEKIDYIFRTR